MGWLANRLAKFLAELKNRVFPSVFKRLRKATRSTVGSGVFIISRISRATPEPTVLPVPVKMKSTFRIV